MLVAPLLPLACIASSKPFSFVSGSVRVQVLSPTLVRIEKKGPKGFEDRPTFHVVNRDFSPEVKVRVTTSRGGYTFLHLPNGNQITLKSKAKTLADVSVGSGTSIFVPGAQLENSRWLPEPGSKPTFWSFADTPRIVPSKYGLTPAPGNDPTSGWDLSNDAPDLYVFVPKGRYEQLRSDFLHLTGPIEMPPLYALGYIDSRYYAYTEKEALDRIDEYRRRQIPLDTFVIDTDWRLGGSHGYKCDPKYFPDMPRFLKAAHDRKVRIMFNDHPEPQAKTALDPKELAYRFEGLSGLMKQGVDWWWYDRNWYVGLVPPAPNLARETWGMMLYHDVTQRTRPNQRPLMMANVDGIDNGFLNRPPNVAAHRYPVQWTGDTRSEWIFLRRGVENAVLSGVLGLNAWVNEDLGGHVGQPSPELYIRYLQYGALCPVMRVHSTKGQTREPWAFGPDATRIVPDYIKLRYRLLPLLYTSAHEAYASGEPIVRRLDLDYPQYANAARNDQYLIGKNLLVAPIVGGNVSAAVPAAWLKTDSGLSGLTGTYWSNQNLSGDPVMTRVDADVNFNWGDGGPDKSLPNDHFSARWTGRIGPIPGNKPVRIAMTGDDGVRLWIDGKLVVDKWIPQDSVTTEAPVDLLPGSVHDIKIEYFEQLYGAVCKLVWRPVEGRDVSTRDVWIPPGTWIDLWNGSRLTGPRTVQTHAALDQIPLFMKEGGIVPLAPEMQYTGQNPWTPITLEVFPSRGRSTYDFYEDDGLSNDYRKGAGRTTRLEVERAGQRVVVRIAPAQGSYAGAPQTRSWKVRLHLSKGQSLGSVMHERGATYRVVEASAGVMPLKGTGPAGDGKVVEITIPSSNVAKKHEVSAVLRG